MATAVRSIVSNVYRIALIRYAAPSLVVYITGLFIGTFFRL